MRVGTCRYEEISDHVKSNGSNDPALRAAPTQCAVVDVWRYPNPRGRKSDASSEIGAPNIVSVIPDPRNKQMYLPFSTGSIRQLKKNTYSSVGIDRTLLHIRCLGIASCHANNSADILTGIDLFISWTWHL